MGFAVKTTERERKLKFLFSIYDLDNDGLISNEELFTVLKMMVGSNLKDKQLQQIVDKTILALDKDEDGMINYKEFCDIIGDESQSMMTSQQHSASKCREFRF